MTKLVSALQMQERRAFAEKLFIAGVHEISYHGTTNGRTGDTRFAYDCYVKAINAHTEWDRLEADTRASNAAQQERANRGEQKK